MSTKSGSCGTGVPAPSAWVTRFAALIPPGGRVLDVACGGGRHARVLAAAGHPVTAVDRDVSRLPADPAIEAVRADLEDGAPWPLPGRTFDAVVVANYLHRPLFPVLAASLAPGGVLIYETFAAGNERYGRPRNPDFLLRPGELLDAFGSELTVVAYEAGLVDGPVDGKRVVQRLAAVRPYAVEDAAEDAVEDAAGTPPVPIPPPASPG